MLTFDYNIYSLVVEQFSLHLNGLQLYSNTEMYGKNIYLYRRV